MMTVLPPQRPSGPVSVTAAGFVQQRKQLHLSVSGRIESGAASLFLQERYIEGGKLDNTLTTSDISLNSVPDVWYTDMTVTIKVASARPSEFFVTVNNLFDRDPPIDPRFLAFGTIPTNRSLYDVVGRQFTAGFRFKF